MKRSFILFEVLIALALITLFSFILLSQPTRVYQKELGALKALEYEALSRAQFLEQQELLKANLSLNELSRSEQEAPLERLDTRLLQLENLPAITYSMAQKIWIEKIKQGESKQAALIRIKIFFFEQQKSKPVYEVNYLMTFTEENSDDVRNPISTSYQKS